MADEVQASEQYVSLHSFANSHALEYGVELMAGFYYEQEQAQHFADTEANWTALITQFKSKEVK